MSGLAIGDEKEVEVVLYVDVVELRFWEGGGGGGMG